jgi:hypothetical protein
MTKRELLTLAFSAAMSAAPMRAQVPPPVGFSPTLDGGEFNDTRIVLKPIAPGYCNQWMQSRNDLA